MNEYVLLGLIFLTATAILLLVLRSLFAMFFDPPPAPDLDAEGAPRAPLFGSWTPALAGLAPMTSEGERTVEKALLRAGFYHRSALIDYRAVRSVFTFVPLLLALELALFWDNPSWSVWTIGYGVLFALFGLLLPKAYVNRRGKGRAFQIQRGLPLALDLLSLCLKAGVSLPVAFSYVAHRLKTHPMLAHELDLTHRQAQLRSLSHALRRLGERVQVPEVSTFAHTLAQAEELGSDAAKALLELSAAQRTSLRQEAESQANRTSFWMLFPTIGCLYLAAAILLIAPGFLQLLREGRTLKDVTGETQAMIDRANQTALPVDKLVRPGPGQPRR